jgi:siroheme synthase (precorrin-2 oxidase/ferrochelatase)
VRAGLEWLVSQGEISLKVEKGDELIVSVGTSLKDPAVASRLWVEIQSLLAETAAYRAHFKRVDKDTLLP